MNKLVAMAVLLGSVMATKAIPPLPAARPVDITALPYTITVPGSYYLDEDLFVPERARTFRYPNGLYAAITVSANNVLLDLRGHTLQGRDAFFYPDGTVDGPVGVLILSNNVTVTNGNIAGFYSGVMTMNVINATTGQLTSTAVQAGIKIDYINFTGSSDTGIGVLFNQTNNSFVRNCQFYYDAIRDVDSTTGNFYAENVLSHSSVGIITGTRMPNNTPYKFTSGPYLGK